MVDAFYDIQLDRGPQTVRAELGALQYRLTVRWMESGRDSQVQKLPTGRILKATGWTLDIQSNLGDNIVCGIPLITGVDLLSPYAYLGIGGELWVSCTDTWDAPPVFDDLGGVAKLYFLVRS